MFSNNFDIIFHKVFITSFVFYVAQKSSGFKICIKESSVFIYLFILFIPGVTFNKNICQGFKLLYRLLSLTRYFNAALMRSSSIFFELFSTSVTK